MMEVERESLDDLVQETYGTRDDEISGGRRLMWPDSAVALVRPRMAASVGSSTSNSRR